MEGGDSAFAGVLQIGSPDGPLFSGKLCNKLLQPNFADLDDLELISTNRRTQGLQGFLLVLSTKEECCGRETQVVIGARLRKSAILTSRIALLCVCSYKANGFEETRRLSHQERLRVYQHFSSKVSSHLPILINH